MYSVDDVIKSAFGSAQVIKLNTAGNDAPSYKLLDLDHKAMVVLYKLYHIDHNVIFFPNNVAVMPKIGKRSPLTVAAEPMKH